MIPKFTLIEQTLPGESIVDLAAEIERQLARMNLQDKITPGMSIAITAGSRGIHRIDEIIRGVVRHVKSLGGKPFIVPAMGSHGGATASGQIDLLRQLNITAESMGVPVLSSMEVVEIGSTDQGFAVCLDRYAARAGGIIAVARIKPHTDYRSRIESGLNKMLAIGLGKHKQALAIHRYGVEGLKRLIPQAARVILNNAPIMMGLAVIENGRDETARIIALAPEDFAGQEPILLKEARSLMPALPFRELDILLVGEMGKDISGTGMDTNIIGRVGISGEEEFGGLKTRYIVVLRLSEASHGNALGIGLADITTLRVMNAIDYPVMRQNVITSTFIERGKIPLAFPSDREAIEGALRCLWHDKASNARIAYIPNTKTIDRILVSEGLLEELHDKENIKISRLPRELPFDREGNLPPWNLLLSG
ncbi:MAG: hypothetical protein U1C55_00475 [Smithellaceae bacterium]|nr:hypothetical protein [Smithellaceae bacterium]